MKKRLIIFGVLILMTLWLVNCKRNHDKGTTYFTVKKGSVVEAIYGIGTVTPYRTFDLKLAVPNTITALHVQEGDHVRAGASLVRLDGEFVAPFSGTVTSVPFKVGETVFAQTPILTLVDLSRLYVVVSLEQQGAIKVKPGQVVVLSFESIRDQEFHGVVKSTYPSNGNFFVRIEVSDFNASILPGMTADVAIQLNKKDNVLLVPVSAINESQLILKQRFRNKIVDVKVGIVDGDKAEIVSGNVTPGDQLVVKTAK